MAVRALEALDVAYGDGWRRRHESRHRARGSSPAGARRRSVNQRGGYNRKGDHGQEQQPARGWDRGTGRRYYGTARI